MERKGLSMAPLSVFSCWYQNSASEIGGNSCESANSFIFLHERIRSTDELCCCWDWVNECYVGVNMWKLGSEQTTKALIFCKWCDIAAWGLGLMKNLTLLLRDCVCSKSKYRLHQFAHKGGWSHHIFIQSRREKPCNFCQCEIVVPRFSSLSPSI